MGQASGPITRSATTMAHFGAPLSTRVMSAKAEAARKSRLKPVLQTLAKFVVPTLALVGFLIRSQIGFRLKAVLRTRFKRIRPEFMTFSILLVQTFQESVGEAGEEDLPDPLWIGSVDDRFG